MIRLAILLAATVAAPALAQTMAHDMAGMTMPAPEPKPARKATPKPKTVTPIDPNCPPEHAAMGHCTPATQSPAAPAMADMPAMAAPAPSAPAIDPNCPPEYAAIGPCTPATQPPAASPMPDMPGMATPAPAAPAIDPDCPPEHAAMGHCVPAVPKPLDPSATGTALPAGTGAPPAPPADRAADRFYAPAAMAAADRMMRKEHGGMAFSQIMFNLAEYQIRNGRDGYRWDGEGWFGGDIDRLVVKTEGEGSFGEKIENAEIQALYSRAIDPYFNLQAGVRQDLGAGAKRTYATVGVEGLAPYWFEVEGALFLSDKGDLLGRIEGYYDQRVTQRLMLQPRIELNLAAQDVAASGIGSGLSNAELGLRLRYEIAREFAPYVGVSWDRKVGDTARFARAAGEDRTSRAITLGVRTWF